MGPRWFRDKDLGGNRTIVHNASCKFGTGSAPAAVHFRRLERIIGIGIPKRSSLPPAYPESSREKLHRGNSRDPSPGQPRRAVQGPGIGDATGLSPVFPITRPTVAVPRTPGGNAGGGILAISFVNRADDNSILSPAGRSVRRRDEVILVDLRNELECWQADP